VRTHDSCKHYSHSDHKFEWTTEEWAKYCNDSASKFGYSVETGGIGRAVEPDPWMREDTLGFASQVALFRRRTTSTPQPVRLDHLLNFAATPPVVLRAKHIHDPHPLSPDELALPSDSDQVREAAKEAMVYNRKGTLTFNDLWNHGEISLKCMGDIGALVRAFERTHIDPDTWLVEDEAEGWETKLTWKNFGTSQASVWSNPAILTQVVSSGSCRSRNTTIGCKYVARY
jgi:small RNA 2'-O-methyltransferase